MKSIALIFASIVSCLSHAAPAAIDLTAIESSLNRTLGFELESLRIVARAPNSKNVMELSQKVAGYADGPIFHDSNNEAEWQRYQQLYAQRKAAAEQAAKDYSGDQLRSEKLLHEILPSEYATYKKLGGCDADAKATMAALVQDLSRRYEVALTAGVKSAAFTVNAIKSTQKGIEKICAN